MKKLVAILFTGIFISVAAPLLGAANANASSIYDTTIKQGVPPYKVRYENTTAGNYPSTYDLGLFLGTLTVNDIISRGQNYCGNTIDNTSATNIYNAIQRIAQGKEYIIMARQSDNYSTEEYITIRVNMDSNTPAQWQWLENGSLAITSSSSSIFNFTLMARSNNYVALCYSTEPGNYQIVASSGSVTNRFVESNIPITYPPGYEGETIPVNAKKIDYSVHFTYDNNPQGLRARYTSKVTNPVTSLPDPEYIWWRLYEDDFNVTNGTNVCDTELKKSIVFDTNIHCEGLEIDTSKQYFLVAQVNPINNPNLYDVPGYDITFKSTVFLIDFTKNSTGTTQDCEPGAGTNLTAVVCSSPQIINWYDCFTDTFPHIDVPTCMQNVTLIFNVIQFGDIIVPKWQFNPNCHTLNTLDDWLGLPQNYEVCPQIPSYVRDVVTPFIAFMLGLVTIGFIKKIRTDFDG